MTVMPTRIVRHAKLAALTPKSGAGGKKTKRGVVRQAAKGALLAAGLAIAQTDDSETESKWRLFDPGLLDRLTMPITRYHE
jgi:hypothetical protein